MGFFEDLQKNIGSVLAPAGTIIGGAFGGPAGAAIGGALGGAIGGGGSLGNMLGTNNNFQANQAPITNPVTPEQLQNGYGQVQHGFGDQANLAQILQQQALGQGINPAQNMLNQATGQNVSNQAALMAGQRGAGANTGLIARQAAQQGANIQQQGIGQAATLGAQQQLAALNQLQQQQALMQQGALGNQGQLLGAQGAFNNAQVGNVGGANQINQNTAGGNAQRNAGLTGGLLNGIGAAIPLFNNNNNNQSSSDLNLNDGNMWAGGNEGFNPSAVFANQGGMIPDHLQHAANIYHSNYAQGGQVKAMVSPGEKYIPPFEAQKVAEGQKLFSQAGEKIGGKAKVKGDSKKNDTVPKILEAGGIVIPKSIMESKDPVKEGTKFLIEAMKKHGKSGKEESDFHEALKKAAANRGKK